jgi:putative Mg2+ transporter-C (MgtC) family protein
VGSAVYTLASIGMGALGSDPGRVAAQVATGMGFLGAGTIIRHGNVVRGLTTAASLWGVAAIGICVGLGGNAYWIAALATAVVLLTLTVLQSAESRFGGHGTRATLTVHTRADEESIRTLQASLEQRGIVFESLDLSRIDPGDLQEARIAVRLPEGTDLASLASFVCRLTGFVSLQSE